MPRRVDSPQGVLASRKRLVIGHLDICFRHALTIVGIDGNLRAQTFAQGCGSPDMVGMAVRDEDAPDAAAFLALRYQGVEVSGIVNCRVEDDSAFISAAQHDSIGTRPCHNRGIGSQDNGIGRLHLYPLRICSGTSQVLPESSCKKTRALPSSCTSMGIRAGTRWVAQ